MQPADQQDCQNVSLGRPRRMATPDSEERYCSWKECGKKRRTTSRIKELASVDSSTKSSNALGGPPCQLMWVVGQFGERLVFAFNHLWLLLTSATSRRNIGRISKSFLLF